MADGYLAFNDLRRPEEINHLLHSVLCTREANGYSQFERVRIYLGSRCFRGQAADFRSSLEVAEMLGFVDVGGDYVRLTSCGKSFAHKNPGFEYELTEAQLEMLVTLALFSYSPFSKVVDEVLSQFVFNRNSTRYERVREVEISNDASAVQRFLFSLRFVRPNSLVGAFVDPRYNEAVARKFRILHNPEWCERQPTDDEISEAQHAEDLVAQSERKRLEAMGRRDLAERVEEVCRYDASAGFDIMSFEGKTSRIEEYDRFIEVKSSRGGDLSLFMSRNEMNQARVKGERYHLLFVGSHKMDRTLDDCMIEDIPNPAVALFDTDRFIIDSKSFAVRRIGGMGGRNALRGDDDARQE